MANAQDNFRKAFIITNTNDTVYGFVDMKTDKRNAELCRFKISESGEVRDYFPGNIIGYRFVDDGKFYVTRIVEIDSVKQSLFLEFLVEGKMNLYYYLKDRTDYYFFDDEEHDMVLVTKKTNQFLQYNDLSSYEDNKYKGVMAYLFKDVNILSEKSREADFNRTTMIEFTKEYHDSICTTGGSCILFENDYKKLFVQLFFSMYSGLQQQNHHLSSNYRHSPFVPNNYLLTFSTESLSPVGGIQIFMVNPRISKSIGFNLDLSVSKLKLDSEWSNGYVYTYYKQEALNGMGEISLKYRYHKGWIRPTVECGLAGNYLFNTSSTFYYKQNFDSYENTSEKIFLSAKTATGYHFSAGVDFQMSKKQFVFLQLAYNSSKSGVDELKISELKFGYRF